MQKRLHSFFNFKCAISCLVATFISLSAWAQNEDTYAGIFLEGGINISSYKLKTFEDMLVNYNQTNASNLLSPLTSLSPGKTKYIGIGAFIGVKESGILEMIFTKAIPQESMVSATLKNGDRREFKLRYAPVEMNFDFIFNVNRKLLFGPTIGLQIQHAKLYSGFRYSNGTLSYGEDQHMNGIFTFRENLGMPLGLRLDYNIVDFLRLSFRANYSGLQWGIYDEKKPSLNPHRDEMMAKATGGSVYRDGYTRYGLQVENQPDGKGFIRADDNRDVSGGFAMARPMKGFQYTVSLKFNVKSWEF